MAGITCLHYYMSTSVQVGSEVVCMAGKSHAQPSL